MPTTITLDEVAVPALALTGVHDDPRLSLIGDVHGRITTTSAAVNADGLLLGLGCER